MLFGLIESNELISTFNNNTSSLVAYVSEERIQRYYYLQIMILLISFDSNVFKKIERISMENPWFSHL